MNRLREVTANRHETLGDGIDAERELLEGDRPEQRGAAGWTDQAERGAFCPSTVTRTVAMGHSSSRPSARTTCRDPIGRQPRSSTMSRGNLVYVAPVSTITDTRRLREGSRRFPTVSSMLNVPITATIFPRAALPEKRIRNQAVRSPRPAIRRPRPPRSTWTVDRGLPPRSRGLA